MHLDKQCLIPREDGRRGLERRPSSSILDGGLEDELCRMLDEKKAEKEAKEGEDDDDKGDEEEQEEEEEEKADEDDKGDTDSDEGSESEDKVMDEGENSAGQDDGKGGKGKGKTILRTPGATLADMMRASAGKAAGKNKTAPGMVKAWFIVEIENTSKWGMMIT